MCSSQVQALLLNRYHNGGSREEALLIGYIPRDYHQKSSSLGNITTLPNVSYETREWTCDGRLDFHSLFRTIVRFAFRVSIFLYLAICLIIAYEKLI